MARTLCFQAHLLWGPPSIQLLHRGMLRAFNLERGTETDGIPESAVAPINPEWVENVGAGAASALGDGV